MCRNTHPFLLFLVMNLFFFHFLQQIRSKDKVVQSLVGCGKDLVFVPFPFFPSLIDEDDAVSDTHHRVHVVCVDDGCHVVFGSDVMNQ